MLESAYNRSTSLQQALERLNDSSKRSSKSLDALEGQIRDVTHQLEDVLEFYELNSYEYEEVIQQITSFVEAVKKMEKEYIEELSGPLTEEYDDDDDDDDDDAAIADFGMEMVGHSSPLNTILNHLLRKIMSVDSYFYSFLGEKGSGRTAAANNIFEDEGQLYECCAWVTLGTTHQELKEVVIRILEQVDHNEVAALLLESGEEDEKMICTQLYKALEHRKYMIVLDDVRSVKVFDCLRSSFPDQGNGSIVLVTTNQEEIAQSGDLYEPLLFAGFEQNLWTILRMCIFHHEHVSPELEEAGRKIIYNCRCRYIPFFKTFLFLYKSEKTVEEWSKIAANKEHPIFLVGDEI